MRKLVLLMHVSLDGYVAGPNGEMDWITVNEEIFDVAGELTENADAALYGRNTYEMMENYWPTAGDKPNASKHSRHHSAWYNNVEKIIFSTTLKDDPAKKRTVVVGDIKAQIEKQKSREGKDILAIGSPTAVHALIKENLVDEYRLFVNPVVLGTGIKLFEDVGSRIRLTLVESKLMPSGVLAVHYSQQRA